MPQRRVGGSSPTRSLLIRRSPLAFMSRTVPWELRLSTGAHMRSLVVGTERAPSRRRVPSPTRTPRFELGTFSPLSGVVGGVGEWRKLASLRHFRVYIVSSVSGPIAGESDRTPIGPIASVGEALPLRAPEVAHAVGHDVVEVALERVADA
jgi:hypothetical protein